MLAKSSKHNFWEYEFTDYNSVHFPEVLRLFYPKPLKNFKLTPLCHLLQQILMELAAKPQKKKKKKNDLWNFVPLKGGVYSKTNGGKTFWIWHWHPEPGLFKMVASRFGDLEKPSLLPSRERQRGRVTNLGLEERKPFCYFVEVFSPEASRVNTYDMLVWTLSLDHETFLCNTI